MAPTKWVIILGIVLVLFEDFACVPCCRDDKDVTSYEEYQNLTPLEDISMKFSERNCLVRS